MYCIPYIFKNTKVNAELKDIIMKHPHLITCIQVLFYSVYKHANKAV